MNTGWTSDWRLVGEKGSALWDGAADIRAQVPKAPEGLIYPTENVEIDVTVDPHYPGGHEGIIREFVDCVKMGKTPETICADNIKSLAMVLGAIESGETGKVVEIG